MFQIIPHGNLIKKYKITFPNLPPKKVFDTSRKGEGTLWGVFGPVNWAKNRNVDRAYILLIIWSQYIGLERC